MVILFVYAALIGFLLWVCRPKSTLSKYGVATSDPGWAISLRPLVPEGVKFTAYTSENLNEQKYNRLLANVDKMTELLEDRQELNAEFEFLDELWQRGEIHEWVVKAGGSDTVEAAISIFYHPEITDWKSFERVATKLRKKS